MRGARGRSRLLVAIIVAALALASVPALGAATAGASVRANPVQGISWQTCPPGSAGAEAGGFRGPVLIPAFIGLVPRVLLRDYDIVSWDPRGVGASTAVQCFPNLDAENAFLGDDAYFPARPDQQAGYISRWATFGKICKARNGELLRHVSTADTARDLNLLRRSLGQPKLNYVGVSYGSYLGATYANLFPRRG